MPIILVLRFLSFLLEPSVHSRYETPLTEATSIFALQVVLLAMGGYGAGYLGWQIRTSEDTEVSNTF